MGVMFSMTTRMPSRAPRSRPSSVLSSADSPSGISKPRTRSAPMALTHRAAETLLSIPPDRPMTVPRRLRARKTWWRTAPQIFSSSADASSRSTSAEKVARSALACNPFFLESWLCFQLPLHKTGHAQDGVQVVGDELGIADRHRIGLFEESNQLEDA